MIQPEHESQYGNELAERHEVRFAVSLGWRVPNDITLL